MPVLKMPEPQNIDVTSEAFELAMCMQCVCLQHVATRSEV